MMFRGVQGEMWRNSFFSGYHYSTRDVNSGDNMNDTSSFSYHDLYLRHFKDVLKETMLKHETVFQDQIHELHRLYRRQEELRLLEKKKKELRLEMEDLCPNPSFSQSSSQHIPSKCHTTSMLSLNQSVSSSKTSMSSEGDNSAMIPEFPANEGKKSGKVVLDLELPACDYLHIGEQRALQQEGKVHESPTLLRESSTRSITLMSDFQPDDLHVSIGASKLKCMLDLNEPVETPKELDSELNFFVDTSSAIVEESCTLNDKGAAETGPQETNEVRVPPPPEKCQTGNGIDLNMSLPCEEKPTVQENIESEQTQESLSGSFHGQHGLARSSMVVQALPCFKGLVSSRKRSKSSTRSSWPRKKVKCGPKATDVASVPQSKACKGSDFDLNSGVNADDDPFPGSASFVPEMDLQAPISPENKGSTRSSTESDNNQTSAEKDNSNSLVDVDSLQKQTYLKNKEGGPRNDLENRGTLLATEEEEQERTAAEAIVDISSSSVLILQEISANVACENLHWFAKIASSVTENAAKSESGLSTSGDPSSNQIDYFEAMTLQLTETNVEEHFSLPKTNTANHKTTVSNLATGRPRRGCSRRGMRLHKGLEHEVLQSLASLLRNEVSEDLKTIGRLVKANATKRETTCVRNKAKNGVSARGRRRLCSSPSEKINVIAASPNHVEKRRAIDWGTISRRRRGPRSPAANFQLILSQV